MAHQNTQTTAFDTSAGLDWPIKKWVASIDPLRGLAALAVVVHHAWREAYPHPGPNEGFAFWLGVWGVALFFVLSGFCIHLPQALTEARTGEISLDWRRFYYRRARRLLPTHYAALILSALVGLTPWLPVSNDLITRPTVGSFVAHIFMVHVWYFPFFHSINAVFWTIAIEIQFYIVYPYFLRLRQLFGDKLPWLLLLLGLALYLGSSSIVPKGGWRFVGQRLFLVSWWQWSLGAYMADVYASGRARWWTGLILRPGLWAVWGAASLALGCVDPAIHRFHYTYWLLPVLCFLLVGSLVVRAEQFPKLPTLAYVGSFSYSLYLFHPVAIVCAAMCFATPHGIIPLLAYLASATLLSWMFFWIIERRFLSPHQSRHVALGSA